MKRPPLEAWIWMLALVVIALDLGARFAPDGFCAFHWLGIEACPGCGLGRSMTQALRGDIRASWALHPLGMPALLVLAGRVFVLLRRS